MHAPADITFIDYEIRQATPGVAMVTQLDTDSVTYGGIVTPAAYTYNVSMVAYNSSLFNASQHPGFSSKPLFW